MPSPFARVVWNKYEAALLVDTYEKVAKGELLAKLQLPNYLNAFDIER